MSKHDIMAVYSNKPLGGYTLVELLVALSITMMVLGFGIASFSSSIRNQAVAGAASEVATLLNKARARAVSQVKPGVCADFVLDGYKVTITPPIDYKLEVACGGSNYSLEEKKLPSSISFQNSTPSTFLFRVLTGGVEGAQNLGSEVIISKQNYTKTIRIYPNGRISQ